MKDVVVVVGAGGIGQAIARRVGAGRHVVLADLRHDGQLLLRRPAVPQSDTLTRLN